MDLDFGHGFIPLSNPSDHQLDTLGPSPDALEHQSTWIEAATFLELQELRLDNAFADSIQSIDRHESESPEANAGLQAIASHEEAVVVGPAVIQPDLHRHSQCGHLGPDLEIGF